jgi:hypothetical protein
VVAVIKILLFIISLCLVACAPNASTKNQEQSTKKGTRSIITELSGRIEQWSDGKLGEIRLDINTGDESFPSVKTELIDSQGRFRIELPKEQMMESFLPKKVTINQLSGVTVSDLNARSASLALEVYIEGRREGYLRLQTVNQYGIYYNNTNVTITYYDRRITFDGVYHRSFGDLAFEVTCDKGWNTTSTIIPEPDRGLTTVARSEPIPKEAKWFLFGNP